MNQELSEFEYHLLEASRTLSESVNLNVASRVVEFRAPQEIIDSIKLQSGHLEVLSGSDTCLTVVKISKNFPRIPFLVSKHYEELPGVRYWFSSGHNFLLVYFNHSSNLFLLHRPDSKFREADLLRLVYLWLAPSFATPIHGGSLSWGSKSALISNVGGSGKSSLIAAAVLSGASTTGDDFGLLQQESDSGDFYAWSQFQTFKLGESSPSLAGLGLTESLFDQPHKAVYSFNQIRAGAVVPRQKIDLLLIPKFGSHLRTEDCGLEDAVSAVGISSAAMSLDKVTAIRAIVRLCEHVPTKFLYLTPDSYANAEFVRELLN